MSLPRPSVRCLVRDGSDQIALVQRDITAGHNPGKWELPGGKADLLPDGRYESPYEAAKREVGEETHLKLAGDTQHIFSLRRPFCGGAFDGSMFRIAVLSAQCQNPAALEPGDGVRDAIWTTPNEALAYDLTADSHNIVTYMIDRALGGHRPVDTIR